MSPVSYVDETIPEELPEDTNGYSFPGRIEEIGFATTPDWVREGAAKFGNAVRERMFVLGIQPLNMQYDRNPAGWQFAREENLNRKWVNYLDKNNNIVGNKTPFGDIRAAFVALGHNFKTNTDAQKLIGKKFMFKQLVKKYAGAESQDVYLFVPTEQLPDDYTFKSDKPLTVKRVGYDDAPAVNADQEATDAPKLISVLNGTTPEQWVGVLASAGLGDYIEEAHKRDPLIARATRLGMSLTDGRLVKV